MTEEKGKNPGFDTIVNQLEAIDTPKAKGLARTIITDRKKALSLINESGQKQQEKKERLNSIRKFVIGLAFNEGDMTKGYKDKIELSQEDLKQIKELKISIAYSNDVMVGLNALAKAIPLTMPNGQEGVLYIYVDQEKGVFQYNFRKNISKADEAEAA